jgi:hypothetical protein
MLRLDGFRFEWRLVLVLIAVLVAGATPAFSGPAASRAAAFTVSVTTLSPLVALIAGILILIMPRLLNYIVALYLILIGLIGLFGR